MTEPTKSTSPPAPPGFWSSLPGVLTALGTVLTAATGLYVVLKPALPAAPPAPPVAVVAPVAVVPPTAPAATAAPAPHSLFNLRATIRDADGHTNVRSRQNSTSDIVTRLTQGETFATYKQDGDWWQVRTDTGQVGYVHISRIKITGPL